jgi:hypothetical protein
MVSNHRRPDYALLCKDRRTGAREQAAMDSDDRKPLLRRVAETAGVSSATVDRVLNERGNVSPKTAQKVINAARQIGLKRILPSPYHKGVRIEVLLIRPELPLIKRINQYFINIASTLDRSVIVNRTILKNDDPKKFASHRRKGSYSSDARTRRSMTPSLRSLPRERSW